MGITCVTGKLLREESLSSEKVQREREQGREFVAARGCVYRSLCLCAGAHKWKIRVTAKNAKGNPRRQKGNKENGKGVMENSISGNTGRDGNNWDFSTGWNRRWSKGQKQRNRKWIFFEEHFHPFPFYICLMTTTVSETNPAMMTLPYKTLLFPSWSTRLLACFLTSAHAEEGPWNCFPVSSEHLITRSRLKRG